MITLPAPIRNVIVRGATAGAAAAAALALASPASANSESPISGTCNTSTNDCGYSYAFSKNASQPGAPVNVQVVMSPGNCGKFDVEIHDMNGGAGSNQLLGHDVLGPGQAGGVYASESPAKGLELLKSTPQAFPEVAAAVPQRRGREKSFRPTAPG